MALYIDVRSQVLGMALLFAACGDGSLAPECRVDSDCAGAHAVCDATTGGGVCACAAGFTSNGDGVCAWSGVIKAPGLDATSSDEDFAAWNADPLIMLDRTAGQEGSSWMVDPGAAIWPPGDATCKQAVLRQTVRMPRYSRSGPLVLEVSYIGPGNVLVPEILSVGLGAAALDLWSFATVANATDAQPEHARFCLGPGAYAPESSTGTGVETSLNVRPGGSTFRCKAASLVVDRVDVVPAEPDECPMPGEVVNGDVEGTGGWTFVKASHPVYDPLFVAGAGEAGSRGVRLICDADGSALVLAPMSIPTTPTALSLFVRTSAGAATTFRFGGGPASVTIQGTGTGETHCFRVPDALHGLTTNLTASLSPTKAGACDPAVEAVIDSVRLVDDASCHPTDTVSDPNPAF